MPCLGDNTTMCGGDNRISVYDTATSAPLGCYVDSFGAYGWYQPPKYAERGTFTVSLCEWQTSFHPPPPLTLPCLPSGPGLLWAACPALMWWWLPVVVWA